MASPSSGTSSEKPPAQNDPSPTADEVEPAPDSLLSLSDDAVRVVIKFLSLADLSKFEVCVRLRRLITPRWKELLADAEKRTGTSRPAAPCGGPNAAYCSKLSLMYLLRSVDCVADVEERNMTGDVFTMTREKLKDMVRECDHVFVRISQKAGSSEDGGSCYRVAWHGFVSAKLLLRGHRNSPIPEGTLKLSLPAEASLYELHPYAKAFKEDFKAFQREDISVPEWEERKQLAVFEARGKTIVSVVATRIDRGKNEGAIFSEMITSSRINGRIIVQPPPFFNNFVIKIDSSRWGKEPHHYYGCDDILFFYDENRIYLNLV